MIFVFSILFFIIVRIGFGFFIVINKKYYFFKKEIHVEEKLLKKNIKNLVVLFQMIFLMVQLNIIKNLFLVDL